jgi:hypothetical protein
VSTEATFSYDKKSHAVHQYLFTFPTTTIVSFFYNPEKIFNFLLSGAALHSLFTYLASDIFI